MRSSSPRGVTDPRAQASSVCSGTCDWTNSAARSGSMPAASRPTAISKVRVGQLPRLVGLRDRVQVHDAEDAIVVGLQGHPVPDRAEVVADMQLARGLDSREDRLHPRVFSTGRRGAARVRPAWRTSRTASLLHWRPDGSITGHVVPSNPRRRAHEPVSLADCRVDGARDSGLCPARGARARRRRARSRSGPPRRGRRLSDGAAARPDRRVPAGAPGIRVRLDRRLLGLDRLRLGLDERLLRP